MADALREIIASFGIEFDDKELEKGESSINGMIEKLKKFGPALAEAFVAKEVVEFGMGLAEQAEQLEIHAQVLGMSTDALQKWQFAANLSGVSADELQASLQKMSRTVVQAQGSGAKLGTAFKGLDFKRADGTFKDTDELLTDVAATIGGMTDSTLQAAAAAQIFGRSGARMLPFLKKGAAGIAEMKAEVDDLGGGFNEEFIEKSKEMIQDSKRLDFALLGLKVNAVGPLIDLMAEFADGATKIVVELSKWIKNSNATKTALIVLGVAGAAALLPLLMGIAPIVLGFLALEDAITFLTGGDSLIGDWVDENFGPGSQKKVQAFFAAIKDSGITDALMALRGAFSIFTDGQPIDVKFKELMAFIDGTLRPQLKKDFGEVGDQIAVWTELLSGTLAVLTKIIEAFEKVAGFIGKGVGKAIFGAQDAAANEEAKGEAALRSGKHVTSVDDIQAAHDAEPFYERALQRVFLGKFDAKAMTPVLNVNPDKAYAAADMVVPNAPNASVSANVATAPANQSVMPAPSPTPALQQDNKTNIIQNFYATTPEDVQKAASQGAKDGATKGVTEGGNSLLATQAAVKKTGG